MEKMTKTLDGLLSEDALDRKRERQEREGLYSPNRRLELPLFDGSEAEDRVARVEQKQPKMKSEEENQTSSDIDGDNADSWESREERVFNRNKRWKELSLVKIREQKEELRELIERKQKNALSTLKIQIPVVEAVVCEKVVGVGDRLYQRAFEGVELMKPQKEETFALPNSIQTMSQGEVVEDGLFSWENLFQKVESGDQRDGKKKRKKKRWKEPNSVKIHGQDRLSLATDAPEQAEKGWGKAMMIGIKVKMRSIMKWFELRNLKQLEMEARMGEAWAITAVEDWNDTPEQSSGNISRGSDKGNHVGQ